MTKFLPPETIRAAVNRLGESRAHSILLDYLIFKRALINANQVGKADSVVTGIKANAYVTAINELSRVADPAESELPYFSPFGARRDKGRGYKSKKYPSNGPSDTVSRWQSRPDRPIDFVSNTSPKEFKPLARSASELEGFLLVAAKSTGQTDKPRLSDLAIWYHRATDIGSLASNGNVEVSALVAETKAALDLTEVELAGLFDTTSPIDSVLALELHVAPPTSYLPVPPAQSKKAATATTAVAAQRIEAESVDRVVQFVEAKGFIFDPWQIAAFVTAVRTKPFVILAGISGTGKTKLPKLVAEATGAHFRLIPVRPDWTDSSDLLGYEKLGTGTTFVPGHLLKVAREAQENPDQQFFVLLDEMNVARVEYYLAEVLSHLEERTRQPDGTIASDPLVPNASAAEWAKIRLPGNLTIIGSVNMDETTFGFSRKVLDRSFVIEFSSVSLSSIRQLGNLSPGEAWPVDRWRPSSLSLADHPHHSHKDVGRVIAALEAINEALTPMQMQVGYRVRDEIAMFVLSALDCPDSFVGDDESVINPLDLAIAMKVLPRIQGTGPTLRNGLTSLLEWADPSSSTESTTGIETESFPFCADRLTMMLKRLDDTGFTSFWL
jgi:hypothetical protein